MQPSGSLFTAQASLCIPREKPKWCVAVLALTKGGGVSSRSLAGSEGVHTASSGFVWWRLFWLPVFKAAFGPIFSDFESLKKP